MGCKKCQCKCHHQEQIIEGNVRIKGNLIVEGDLVVHGKITDEAGNSPRLGSLPDEEPLISTITKLDIYNRSQLSSVTSILISPPFDDLVLPINFDINTGITLINLSTVIIPIMINNITGNNIWINLQPNCSAFYQPGSDPFISSLDT